MFLARNEYAEDRHITNFLYWLLGEGLDQTQMKELAKNTNAARQSILQEMKQGRILVEIGLNDAVDAGRREDSPLFNFIKTLLDQRLNTE